MNTIAGAAVQIFASYRVMLTRIVGRYTRLRERVAD